MGALASAIPCGCNGLGSARAEDDGLLQAAVHGASAVQFSSTHAVPLEAALAAIRPCLLASSELAPHPEHARAAALRCMRAGAGGQPRAALRRARCAHVTAGGNREVSSWGAVLESWVSALLHPTSAFPTCAVSGAACHVGCCMVWSPERADSQARGFAALIRDLMIPLPVRPCDRPSRLPAPQGRGGQLRGARVHPAQVRPGGWPAGAGLGWAGGRCDLQGPWSLWGHHPLARSRGSGP